MRKFTQSNRPFNKFQSNEIEIQGIEYKVPAFQTKN